VFTELEISFSTFSKSRSFGTCFGNYEKIDAFYSKKGSIVSLEMKIYGQRNVTFTISLTLPDEIDCGSVKLI
jgi:hypothetical protein